MNWLTAHRCSLLCAVPSRILYKSRATPGHPGASAALLMQQVDIQLKPLSGAVLGFVTHAEQWSSSCDSNRSIICIAHFCSVNINSLCFINMQRQEEKNERKDTLHSQNQCMFLASHSKRVESVKWLSEDSKIASERKVVPLTLFSPDRRDRSFICLMTTWRIM